MFASFSQLRNYPKVAYITIISHNFCNYDNTHDIIKMFFITKETISLKYLSAYDLIKTDLRKVAS